MQDEQVAAILDLLGEIRKSLKEIKADTTMTLTHTWMIGPKIEKISLQQQPPTQS